MATAYNGKVWLTKIAVERTKTLVKCKCYWTDFTLIETSEDNARMKEILFRYSRKAIINFIPLYKK